MKVYIKIYKKKKMPNRLLLLFIILCFSFFLILSFLPKEKPLTREKEPNPQKEITEAPPPLKESIETIQKGMTLSDILAQHNFSPADILQMREEVKPIYDLAKIKTGQEIRIYSSQDGKISALEYDLDDESYLSIQKKEGIYKAEIKKFPFEIKIRMIWGIIKDNLPSAVTGKGEKELLAYMISEIFAWDIDFYTDLRQGDLFKIIFEKKYLRDEFVGYGNTLAAEFTNQGETFQAFRFIYHDTKEWDYFNFKGDSLRKEFLKSPIKFARITSRFSYSRLHPIRKVFRPHYGVDYAARIGTEVQVTADGTVTFTGWNGAAGRMIKIRHKNNYETMYLHLRSYAKGIKKGSKVKGGQVIGYVGSSGESTGPHLDYRIKYGGTYINPLAHRFKPVKPLRPEFLEEFKKEAENYCFLFDAPLSIFSCLYNSI
ncbi:MAG: peptidoglycan DD-metalloendopeptidase family protein [Candidatus Aminicenantes bacterium]|nr:peptidoglycan DD-metalloendopeptidase family protein [Candidatus Aminicenantes bacterium]